MHGILGVYFKEGKEKEENAFVLDTMAKAMMDGNRYVMETHIDDRVCIARISLGVINAQPQPVWSIDQRYCLFMDGEVLDYNEKIDELKREGYAFKYETGEEAVINLFDRYGEKFIEYIQGNFVIVLYDSKVKTLYFMNDRFGYRYLYYFEDAQSIVFASEIKAMLNSGIVDQEIDERAICDMLNFHFIIGNKTFFKNIKLLPQGSLCKIVRGDVKYTKYWKYPVDVVYLKDSLDQLIERGTFLLRKAIIKLFKRNLNVGVTISGGLDSRIISAFLAEQSIPFTLIHFGSKGWPETRIANKVAKILDRSIINYDLLDLNFMEVVKKASFLADGQFSSEQYLYLEMVKKSSEAYGVNYVYHGLALDILFGGPFMLLKDNEIYENADITAILRNLYSLLPIYLARKVFKLEFVRYLNQMAYESIKTEIEGFPEGNYAQLGNYFYLNNRGRRYVMGTPQVNKQYVEYAFPGLDYDLYDFAIRVPLCYRRKRELYRAIFMKNFEELSKISYAATGLPLDKWNTPLSDMKEKSKKYLYYLSRITRGKIDFHSPVDSLDRRFRKDSEFSLAISDFLRTSGSLPKKYLKSSGVNQLIMEQSAGKNYFSGFNGLISLYLFFEQYVTR